MPGREEDGEWFPWRRGPRSLEGLTVDNDTHGRFSMKFGSTKAGAARWALLTRWVGLEHNGVLVPLFLEFSDAPEYRKGGQSSNDKPAA